MKTFRFDRYIDGKLMAQGVKVEKSQSLSDAMIIAARIAERGPDGEVPVLIYDSEYTQE